MDPQTEARLRQLVRDRITRQAGEIRRSLTQIAAGNPLGAEPEAARRAARIAAKGGLTGRDALALAEAVERAALAIDRQRTDHTGAEALQGPTMDLVGVHFLTRGRLAANAVGRVTFKTGRAQGSGFLVGPGLFLTNQHVIPSAEAAAQMVVEFDYEADEDGVGRPVTTFKFDWEACFESDPIDQLDFTLIGIGTRLAGDRTLESLGYLALSDASDKHMLGEIANIIQHPQGTYKQLVVRENSLVSRDETHSVLHYLADTEQGSSGSPVCNNAWEPIALHHWGEPHREITDAQGRPLRRDVNEGIRISAIVSALKNPRAGRTPATSRALAKLLQTWGSVRRSGPVGPAPESLRSQREAVQPPRPRVTTDGCAAWTVPLEVSVRLPLLGDSQDAHPAVPAPPPAVATTPSPEPLPEGRKATSVQDFSDRNGYEPGFIPGFVVPLPDWRQVKHRVAVNQFATHQEDPNELRYHHFSIVMNADRRLALFTACNIDGRRLVAINRRDKTTLTSPTLQDLGAESSDDFRRDPRILDAEQMTVAFYQDQKVPGHDKPPFPGADATPDQRRAYARAMNERTARMFQKGHLTLRGDPAWGTADQAVLAEADTFYYTNAAPQLGFFNQGSPEDRPGSKGKLRWRAVETYVLRNAFTSRQRVSVFAGPVFDDENDPDYRFGCKVPMRFWKLVVWKGASSLRALALLADQRPVLEQLTDGMPEALEAFESEEELARVSDFLSTVEEIEALTGLRFVQALHQADLRRGQPQGPSSQADGDPPDLDPA